MKSLPLILSACLAIYVISNPLAATPANAESDPGASTEPALACLLGFSPWQCARTLWGGAVWPITNCAKQYVHRRLDNCHDGPLEAVDYLGINAQGADIYEVRFMNADAVYIIAPPGPNGKLGQFWIRRGPPAQIIPTSLVQVTAPADQKIALYRRPWH
jgi:hypothetical protein